MVQSVKQQLLVSAPVMIFRVGRSSPASGSKLSSRSLLSFYLPLPFSMLARSRSETNLSKTKYLHDILRWTGERNLPSAHEFLTALQTELNGAQPWGQVEKSKDQRVKQS